MLAVTLASAEVRQGLYDREQSCTTDEAQTVVKKRSKIHCAAACNHQLGCREYNFDEETKDCSLYKHKPLFFEAQPTCSRYKARYSCGVVVTRAVLVFGLRFGRYGYMWSMMSLHPKCLGHKLHIYRLNIP